MSKKKVDSFRRQMADSLADVQSIVALKQSPTGDGRFSARTVDVAEPAHHTARTVKSARTALGVSQPVFAKVMGVSAPLVRAWEQGTREPSPIARRLLDLIRRDPNHFLSLIHRVSPERKRAS